MEKINLEILKKIPSLDTKVTLVIEPLAPLSMVSDLPGSFYKTLKSPTKKMLCGLFENILGWHISIAHREMIQKELIKLRKKQKIDFKKPQTGSTYIPLLMEYFEIELITVPPVMYYNDLWSKAYRRADAVVHPKGTMNISYELIPEKRKLPRDPKKPKQIAGKEIENLFKNNLGKFPIYYSSPTEREYINYKGKIEIDIEISSDILSKITESLRDNNCFYFGNSEGWINLTFKSHE